MAKLEIYRPILSDRMTQGFGENKACFNPDNGKVSGFSGNSCPAGTIGLYKHFGMLGHNGEDWTCWYDEPIFHSGLFDGWAHLEVDSAGGIGVDIVSVDPIYEGNYIKLRYWHLRATKVKEGEIVRPGQLIGHGDSTGASSGDHLHWALKPCKKDAKSLNEANGYYGAIDFRPYFENVFILDVLKIHEEAKTAIRQAQTLIDRVVQWLNARVNNFLKR